MGVEQQQTTGQFGAYGLPKPVDESHFFGVLSLNSERHAYGASTFDEAQACFTGSVGPTGLQSEAVADKLSHIGLTPESYVLLYDALRSREYPLASSILAESIHNHGDSENGALTTRQQYHDGYKYSDARRALHGQIIASALSRKADDHRRDVPNFHLIVGPPTSGKTTRRMMLEEATPSITWVKTDVDQIRPYLLPDFDPSNDDHIRITQKEASDIANRIFFAAIRTGMDVVAESTLRDVQWRIGTQIPYVMRYGYRRSLTVLWKDPSEWLRIGVEERLRPVSPEFILTTLGSLNNYLRLIFDPRFDDVTIVDTNNTPTLTDDHIVYSRAQGNVTSKDREGLRKILHTANQCRHALPSYAFDHTTFK